MSISKKIKSKEAAAEEYSFLKELSYSEKLLLSFYSICDTAAYSEKQINSMLQKVDKDYNYSGRHDMLVEKGLIRRERYIFEQMEFSFIIEEQYTIPTLIWLYTTNEGISMLNIVLKSFKHYKLNSKSMQIAVIDFINSGFKDTSTAFTIFSNDVKSLISIINNSLFQPFLMALNKRAFEELINQVAKMALNGKLDLNTESIISLINNKKTDDFFELHNNIGKIYTYAFLKTGETMIAKAPLTEYDFILNAIVHLYKGEYSESVTLFEKALIIHNKSISTASLRGYFEYPIINFLWTLASYKDERKVSKRHLVMIQAKDDAIESTKAAKAFTLVINNVKGYIDKVQTLFRNADIINKQLIMLVARLAGRTDLFPNNETDIHNTQWLLLKYENDRFQPMKPEEKAIAEKAYNSPQLSSIHMKQHWEYVIEKLSSIASGKDSEDTPIKSERIAYFISSIYSDFCQPRLQSILKNGGWSSGKQISTATYITLPDNKLSEDDHFIRNSIRGRYYNGDIPLRAILEYMTIESRLYVGRYAPYSLVTVNQEMPYLVIERSDSAFNIKSNVPPEQIDSNIIITSRSASTINYLKMSNELRPYFSQLLDLKSFPIEAEEILTNFLEGLRGKVEIHSTLIKGGSTLETTKGSSDITIQMRPQGKEAYIVSIFCRPLQEGRVQCVPGEGSSVIIDINGQQRISVERDLDAEKEAYDYLVSNVELGIPQEKTFIMDAYDLLPLLDFIRTENEEKKEEGEKADAEKQTKRKYIIEWPEGHKMNIRNRYTLSQWSATLKKNKAGWFEMEGNVQLDENTMLSMSQLMDLIAQNKGRYIRLGEGEYIALSERLRKQLSSLDAIASRSRNKLQISPFSAALLDSSVTEGELFVEIDDELKQIRQKIIDSSNYHPEVPDTLNATLRSYQKEGYQWIARLNSWGAGALLADDMGLGKTIQTITYMLSKADEGPALVVAPASVAPNWKTEFDKFAPTLNVQVLNFSSNRSKCIANAKAGDVIITTYGLLLSVKTEITQKEWNTVCLDEAHVIKNRGAKTSGVAMQLKSKYRIMLTGTPVQNHLGELWNLFQFVNPGLLGSYEDFGRRFITPIEVNQDKERQKELEHIVHPFMLRRTKEKVLSELPEKTEIYQMVELSKEELAVYEVIRKSAEAMLEADGAQKVSVNTLAEITRLRQAACSAQLIEKTWKGKTSKVEALIEALEPIIESGDSALVFSQFTSFLAIVKEQLDKAKIPYLYIDGSVPVKERQKLVKDFQNGKCPVFIISLKAGGLGLNLTRANYVFHLDPWWNPAIEQQATDRSHRIGQHNAVTVYHFLSSNTIEEKIRRLHERKRNLADNILQNTDQSSKLTGKELLEMVKKNDD